MSSLDPGDLERRRQYLREFNVGDKVELSASGMEQGLGSGQLGNRGLVVLKDEEHGWLYVIKYGQKTAPRRYHPSFWMPLYADLVNA